MIAFKGSWDDHLPFIEFAYHNNYHSRIHISLYEALYDTGVDTCPLLVG